MFSERPWLKGSPNGPTYRHAEDAGSGDAALGGATAGIPCCSVRPSVAWAHPRVQKPAIEDLLMTM